MASSCSQSKYEVFLSFRGEDTRNGFTSHLAAALHRKQIQFFIDDEELMKGDEISPALSNAIETSDISIIIFSKDYASSKWCLNELVKILDCKKMNGQIVIPIFYQVDPSDVRKQRGGFGEAFDHHENNFPDKVKKWRDALTEASNLSGYDTTESRNEAELVEKIAADISKKLEDVSDSSELDGFVGLNSQIEKMKSLLCLESHDVRIVGIWGMGGIGKTTIASVVFHQISRHFQGKCFMANIRDESNKMGVIHVRDEVISQVFGENLKIGSLTIPPKIKKRLQRMKVLIVLDDAHDEFTQLESLAGGADRFSPGSRIIITTRDKRVLDKCGVKILYKVKGLKYSQAFELFCRKAFRQNNRSDDLLELSQEIVCYADGNPLALEVLGSSLYEKSKQQWKDKLHNLKLISEPNIYKVLKISYDELNSEEKEIFLDIACFFKGEDMDFVTRIQDDPMSMRDRLSILVSKSLITISHSNRLQMHDLLEEMGQTIVQQESVNEPGKRSRLWDHNDIYHVLKKNKGTDAIEGIFLNLSEIKDFNLGSRAFTNMSNLRLLIFYMPEDFDMSIEKQLSDSKVQLPDGLDYLPEKLRCLHWYKYPLRTLPSNFKPKNLVELNLPFSKVVQIWDGKKKAFKLKYIDLNYSRYLIRMPDLSEIPNVERINLLKCTNLAWVPSSIQNFNHLNELCFSGCKSLRSFPSNLHFVSPITIDFSSCVNLTEFPQISGNITELDLRKTAIEEVPSSIECLNNLECLFLINCTRLNRVSRNICNLKSLDCLCLDGCLSLENFPEILEKMEQLNHNATERTEIRELPSSIENGEGLPTLGSEGCSENGSFPDNIAISQPPSSVAESNEYKEFSLTGCRGLVSIALSSLSGLSTFGTVDLSDCALTAIPKEIGCLSSLIRLKLSGNKFESIPASVKQLSRLRELHLCNCNRLQSLPELPLSLKLLEASNCEQLQSLPEIPSCLEELDASLLEKLSKHSLKDQGCLGSQSSSPWIDPDNPSIDFRFTNCLKLGEEANNKNLADSQVRIQHMAIASFRLFCEVEEKSFKVWNLLGGPTMTLPGREIPDWISNQSSGSDVTLQLPQQCCQNLMGFAFCVVLESGYYNPDFHPFCSFEPFDVHCICRIERNILSERKRVRRGRHFIGNDRTKTDHVMLGFSPFGDVGFRDGNLRTTVSFQFLTFSRNKVVRCGVCPVYVNPSEINPNTFTLTFVPKIGIRVIHNWEFG